jgi:hypothetical protein
LGNGKGFRWADEVFNKKNHIRETVIKRFEYMQLVMRLSRFRGGFKRIFRVASGCGIDK